MRKASEFYNKPICAVDDEIGKLTEFYIDERSWQIRYLVVNLGSGFKSKEVLISPVAFASFDGERLKIQLTKDEIHKCPVNSSAKPVYIQQKENAELLYSTTQSFGGFDSRFETVVFPPSPSINSREDEKGENPHFRSSREISGYKILTEDGVEGKVEDLLFDDRLWNIRFLLIRPDTGSDQETRLLIAFWVDHIEWEIETIYLGCRGDYLMRCPKFDPSKHVNISYEDFLDHYNMVSKNM